MAVASADDPLRCVSAIINGVNARHGERCRSVGSYRVGGNEFVCWNHQRWGWLHFERAAVADGMAERMRAVSEP